MCNEFEDGSSRAKQVRFVMPYRTSRLRCAVMALIITLTAHRGAEAVCTSYENYFHLLGGVNTLGQAIDIAIAGTKAYVADNNSGLQCNAVGQGRLIRQGEGRLSGRVFVQSPRSTASKALCLEVSHIPVPPLCG
jgi:hypothetical protein